MTNRLTDVLLPRHEEGIPADDLVPASETSVWKPSTLLAGLLPREHSQGNTQSAGDRHPHYSSPCWAPPLAQLSRRALEFEQRGWMGVG